MGDFTTAGEVESVTAHEVININGEIDKAMFDLKKKELLEEKERLERQLEGRTNA